MSGSSQSCSAFVEQKFGKFAHFVIYALLEWVMIIVLFVDGFLAFISNEFARFFELKIPCLFCTRFDHVFVHRPSNFYFNDSICEAHKKHMSSLAYCNVHKKLSDIRSMCEGCLLPSFATDKDSDDFDRQVSIVGMFQKDVADGFAAASGGDEQKTSSSYMAAKSSGKKEDEVVEGKCNSWCCCCGDPLKAKKSSSKLNRNYSMNNNNNIAPTPSPRAPMQVSSWKYEGMRNLELPHMQYTEFKFFSDNESELPDEEDSASNAEIRRREDIKAAAAATATVADTEETSEDAMRTPIFGRGNKFFGIPLSDSSPRYYNKTGSRKMMVDMMISEPNNDMMNVVVPPAEGGGESELNRLRRQVRIDRKSLIELYMELDEERSASAVAANNAMAMITRLQAEKAAVQMEALQYQRMMEEQAEYDQEAIQELRELAMKREDEIKALEAGLDLYRERHGPITMNNIASSEDIYEVDAYDDYYEDLKSQFDDNKSDCSSPGESYLPSSRVVIKDNSASSGVQNFDELSLDFESERSYILDFLTRLEKELNTSSHAGDEEHDHIGNEGEKISSLTKQVHFISERLKEIEADSSFLKHAAAMNMHKGGEGTRLLMEIAQHLRHLRRTVKNIPESTNGLPFSN